MFNPLQYPIIFTRPERIAATPTSAWIEHVPFGMAAIALTEPRVVVELGTFSGISYCAFCQAVEKLELGTRCYAIDTWQGDEHTGPMPATILDDLRGYHDPRYGGFSTLIESRFDDALAYFADNSIDLLHIDGYHTYEAARRDFDHWLPKLSSRGVVLLHDIEVRIGDFGVWRLWDELRACYPHFSFQHGYGLGLVAVGEEIPAALHALFDAGPQEVHRIRRFFFDLGRRLGQDLEQHQRAVALAHEHERVRHNLTAQIADMEHSIQIQAKLLADNDTILQSRDHVLAERERAIEFLQHTVDEAIHARDALAQEQQSLVDRLGAYEQERQHLLTRLQIIEQRLSWHVLRGAWEAQRRLAPPQSPQGRAWIAGTSVARKLLGQPPIPGVHDARIRPVDAIAPGANGVPASTDSVIAVPAPEDERWEVVPSHSAAAIAAPDEHAQYRAWVEQSATLYDRASASRAIAAMVRRPLISIIVPVYNTDPHDLRAMIDSVRAQYYPDWELCLSDDASTVPHIRQVLLEYADLDARIKVTFATQNGGIALASNRAIELASGSYLALLDHDDALTPDALYAVALALQDDDADIIYSDNDVLSAAGERLGPLYKPAWCPELFLSVMYTCHFSVYRRALIDAVGGFAPGFDGGQDLEMVLRFLPQVRRVVHIPRVLYSWRMAAGSASRSIDAKPYAYNAVRRALDTYLQRQAIPGEARFDHTPGYYHIRRTIAEPLKASILLVAHGNDRQLRRCVDSIEAHTAYRHYEIIIVHCAPGDRDLTAYLAQSPHRVLHDTGPFNLSRLYNRAAAEADGEYLVLLDSDCEVLAPEWLSALIEQGQLPSVGAVGAKLLDSGGLIHHAGIILNTETIAAYSQQGLDGYDGIGFLNVANLVANYSAVSGECLLLRRDVFHALGGLNEDSLALAFADVDLCLRLRQRGYSVVFTPFALLRQHRSARRPWDGHAGMLPDPVAIAYMRREWGRDLADDPCYSPNLRREAGRFFQMDTDKPEGSRYLYVAPPGTTPVGSLIAGRVLSQNFIAEGADLCGISLRFATHRQRCRGVVHLALHDRGEPIPVRTLEIDAATILDNQYRMFLFEPIADSTNRYYRFSIAFAPAPDSPELTVYASELTDVVAGPYQDSAIPKQGTLDFKTFAIGPQFRDVVNNVPVSTTAPMVLA